MGLMQKEYNGGADKLFFSTLDITVLWISTGQSRSEGTGNGEDVDSEPARREHTSEKRCRHKPIHGHSTKKVPAKEKHSSRNPKPPRI